MMFVFAGISLLLVSGINQTLMQEAFATYYYIGNFMLALTAAVGLVLVFFNQAFFGGYSNLKEIIKRTIKFLIIYALFPTAVQISTRVVEGISQRFVDKANTYESVKSMSKADTEKVLTENLPELSIISGIAKPTSVIIADWFQVCVRYLTVTIAIMLDFIRNALLATFISLAPIFLMLGILMGIQFFSNAILTIGVMLIIWPLMSAILMYFAMMVFKAESPNFWTSISQGASLIIYAFAQMLIPIACFAGGTRAASTLARGLSDGSSSLGTGVSAASTVIKSIGRK